MMMIIITKIISILIIVITIIASNDVDFTYNIVTLSAI